MSARIDPEAAGGQNVIALLDAIAVSEIGAALLAASQDGYNVLQSSTPAHPLLFSDYSDFPDVPIGGAGVTALEGGDFPYTLYIEQMKRTIGSHWLRPQIGDTAAIIYFVIDRDGSMRDAKIETPSGNGLYDRAALRAVLESSPLPPLPFGYNGTYLGVHLKFR